MRRAGRLAGCLVALLLLALAASCHADEGDKKSRLRECEDYFESIDTDIQGCANGLAERGDGEPPGNGTDASGCPLLCRNLFQRMPLYCGRLVDAALEPNFTTSLLVRDGQPVDICATFCGGGELCVVDSTLLPRLDLLRWLPDRTSPVWALAAVKGGGGGGGKTQSPLPDEDDDSGVNVGAVVAGAVVGSVVLAIVGFVAGRMWQARHRRQTTVAAAPPGAAAGGGGKDSMDLEAGWVQQSSQAKVQQSSQATDLDSAAPSPCDPSSTAGTQQASPDGQQGLADLWAQAVLGAAPPPAAQGSPAGTASDAGVQPHDSAFYARAQRQSGRSGGVPSPAASTASDAAVPDSPATGLRRIASRRSTSVLTGSPSTAMGLDRWEVDFSALTLVRTLGEGSAGKVYLGTLNETSVAVKVLTDTSGSSAAGSWASSPALQALHRESSVMAALRHPNVVSCDLGCWWERGACPCLGFSCLVASQPAKEERCYHAMPVPRCCSWVPLLEACCVTDR